MNTNIYTLFQYLRTLAADRPDLPLLGDEGGWRTAEQCRHCIESGAGLLYSYGLRSRDLVALRCERSVNTVLALLCLQRIGVTTVLISPKEDLKQAVAACSPPLPVTFFLSADHSPHCPTVLLTRPAEGVSLSLPLASFGTTPAPTCDNPNAPAFYVFTSGSCGERKAVILSQGNLVSNLLDSAPLGGYFEDDIALGALPLEHVFGLALLTGAAVLGYRLYLTPATSPDELLQVIEREKITRMNGVPSLYLAMAKKARGHDVRSLRAGYIGGAPWTPGQFQFIESTLGMTLVPVYGMSECIGISCSSFHSPREQRMSGVGPFYPANEGKILREDGSEADMGETGEVCVNGPMRMLGYHDSAQTARALDENGFLHTGDLGYQDETGVLHLTGRKKHIIICNGVNLSPRRLEEALLSLPDVQAAAVVGLPDEQCGELPWAAVVCPEESLAGLKDRLQPCLAKNELPAGILRLDAMPMTSTGKPDRQAVQELIRKWRNK